MKKGSHVTILISARKLVKEIHIVLLHLGFKAHPNGEEYDSSIVGKAFKISGRKYSTIHGYYVEMDARDLEKSNSDTLKLLEKDWSDIYTNYIGFLVNFYDPRFKIIMYYLIFYDQRFNYDLLSSVRSKCYLATYASYTTTEYLMLIYTCVAGAISVLLLIFENIEIAKGKLDKQEQFDRI